MPAGFVFSLTHRISGAFFHFNHKEDIKNEKEIVQERHVDAPGIADVLLDDLRPGHDGFCCR